VKEMQNGRGLSRCLVLGFGIQLGPDQNYDDREVRCSLMTLCYRAAGDLPHPVLVDDSLQRLGIAARLSDARK
jgi:hypothetical protein